MQSDKGRKNKFEELKRDELLGLCLQMEDELEKLRPKPAKFKLGQLLAYTGNKNAWMREQPAIYFVVLSLESRDGTWFYGHSKKDAQNWHTFPEKKCRELTKTELDGSDAPAQAMEAQTPGPTFHTMQAPGIGTGALPAVVPGDF